MSLPVSPLLSGAVATALGLAIYLGTLNPTVAGGDSGELMVTAHELATPHPPGYPTFAMLSKAATVGAVSVAPWLGVSVAMNGFHALLSSLALGVIAVSVHLAGGTFATALLAAGMFGFAPNVWTYAIATEVFPLNNLFSALIVLCAVQFDRLLSTTTRMGAGCANADGPSGAEAAEGGPHGTKKSTVDRFVTLSAFVYGLALTNQHTSVLYVGPLVLWVFVRWPSAWRQPAMLARNSAAFFLGLSPYLYLPISNYFVRSPNSWGRSLSWDGFATHFFRKEYGTFSLASQESTYRSLEGVYARNTRMYFGDVAEQLGMPVAAVALVAHVCVVVGALRCVGRRLSSSQSPPSPPAKGKGGKRVAAKAAAVPAEQCQSEGSATSAHSFWDTVVPRGFSAATMLLVTWMAYINFFNYLSNLPIEKRLFYGVQQRFWIQPLIITVFITGVVLGRVERWVCKGGLSMAGVRSAGSYYSWAFTAVCLALVGHQITVHYAQQDESDNDYVKRLGEAILRPLPPNSILFTLGDVNINSVRYCQSLEGFRAGEVLVLDLELLTFPWYINNTADYLEQRRRSNASYAFGDVVFPGSRYYPGAADAFNLHQFVVTNAKKGRRFFSVGGMKEGDDYTRSFLLQDFGFTREIGTHRHSGRPLQRKDMREVDNVRGITAESLAVLTKKGDIVETILSLEDGASVKVPSFSKYLDHTWEYNLALDGKHAYHGVGLMLLNVGQRLGGAQATQGSARQTVPHLGKYLSPPSGVGPGAQAGVLDAAFLTSLPTAVAALVGAHVHLHTALHAFKGAPALGYEAARNLAVAAQELMGHADDPAAFGREVLVPHLEALITDHPSHESLPHSHIRAVIDSL